MSELMTMDQPVDVIQSITSLAKQGPQAVATYAMAFDRLPQPIKDAHVAQLHDARDIRNAEFLELFVSQPKIIRQLVRNADGSIFTNPITGELVYEDVYVPNPNEPIFDRLRAAVS